MASDLKNPLPARGILLLGPYGVLGTGVVDAAAANPAWRVVTAARRQAGFADCIDTHQSFRRQLTRLREMRIIP
jgi:hypothetical protein